MMSRWLVQETLSTRDDWARITYESLIDGAAHGLRYRETFFTPARHLAGGQDLGEIVAGLTEGIEAAEAETGVRCRLIADVDRAYGPGPALELVEQVGELRRAGRADRIIGIGADSTELGVDLRTFAPAFDLARRLGLRRTCHAGEAVGVGPGCDRRQFRRSPVDRDGRLGVRFVPFVQLEGEMAESISISEARDDFAELVNRVAYAHERVRLVRRGRDLAAVVPTEDLELLEALDDELDLDAARDALADPANAGRIPWEDVRARLGR